MFENITDDNFLIYTMKCYNAPHCILSEFESDLKRIKYVRRLFRRYKTTNELKERLILNHIILLNNVFGSVVTPRILFFKVDEMDYDILKSFLMYLDLLPETIIGINGVDIHTKDIPIENNVITILESI